MPVSHCPDPRTISIEITAEAGAKGGVASLAARGELKGSLSIVKDGGFDGSFEDQSGRGVEIRALGVKGETGSSDITLIGGGAPLFVVGGVPIIGEIELNIDTGAASAAIDALPGAFEEVKGFFGNLARDLKETLRGLTNPIREMK